VAHAVPSTQTAAMERALREAGARVSTVFFEVLFVMFVMCVVVS
jgi:hypothetical protein